MNNPLRSPRKPVAFGPLASRLSRLEVEVSRRMLASRKIVYRLWFAGEPNCDPNGPDVMTMSIGDLKLWRPRIEEAEKGR